MIPDINDTSDWKWVGGFAQSNPAFAYPNPDLSSLRLLGNLDNIGLLRRQQAVCWPEFSWNTKPGSADPARCFQMFAPDISRIGYTVEGRVYSIICPQQGIYIEDIGYLNVEVTVTGQRGWVDETTRELAADMTVEGKIWFGPSAHKSSKGAELLALIDAVGYPVPGDKAHAIIVTTHNPGHPDQPIFPVRRGETSLFASPGFAQHPEAWAVGNVEVEIGPIKSTGNADVDTFNGLVMELFNLLSGNMLQSGNVLSWNVWFQAPAVVDTAEWKAHAERWRTSIDEDHGSPDGPGSVAKYFDGTPFSSSANAIDVVLAKIWDYLKSKL